MNKTNIEWCTHTWNPVTGCKRGCKYCYAKRINDRFNKKPFNQIVFHKERLIDPSKEKKPATIFVGSMSDCEYWDDGMWEYVLDVCNKNKHHTFMFLSKSAYSYTVLSAKKRRWMPENCMSGLTVERADNGIIYDKLVSHSCHNHRPFISFEPMLGRAIEPLPKFEIVIVGAMTGKNPIHPTREMVLSVIDNANGNKIFWKNNIKTLYPELCK